MSGPSESDASSAVVNPRRPPGFNPAPNPQSNPRIHLCIVGPDQEKKYFHNGLDTKIGKLFDAYSNCAGNEQAVFEYILDGRRITHRGATATPRMLGLTDGEEILAMEHCMGGSGNHA